MSAWLVDRVHIDLLVGATEAAADPVIATWAGRMLWVENLKSIHARYPDTAEDPTGENRPGPIGVTDDEIRSYTYTQQPLVLTRPQLHYAVACLDYQACEHDGWKTSEARAFLERICPEAFDDTALPEYGSVGPWGWSKREIDKIVSAQDGTEHPAWAGRA